MTSRTIETAISTGMIRDQIIQFLYATGIVREDEDVKSLDFGKLVNLNKDSVIPLKINFKGEEVQVQKLDG